MQQKINYYENDIFIENAFREILNGLQPYSARGLPFLSISILVRSRFNIGDITSWDTLKFHISNYGKISQLLGTIVGDSRTVCKIGETRAATVLLQDTNLARVAGGNVVWGGRSNNKSALKKSSKKSKRKAAAMAEQGSEECQIWRSINYRYK